MSKPTKLDYMLSPGDLAKFAADLCREYENMSD